MSLRSVSMKNNRLAVINDALGCLRSLTSLDLSCMFRSDQSLILNFELIFPTLACDPELHASYLLWNSALLNRFVILT